ncbi:hypothetical protein EDB85DRAFT_1935856 [Lactarius pseudohatsudake]|nr:hypothetical protein EDB85DRAFT_1935856 [Lactarius pseudohatsudake]
MQKRARLLAITCNHFHCFYPTSLLLYALTLRSLSFGTDASAIVTDSHIPMPCGGLHACLHCFTSPKSSASLIPDSSLHNLMHPLSLAYIP